MARETIERFMLCWDIDDNVGRIKFVTASGEKGPIRFEDAARFLVVADMLRSQGPVYYDAEDRCIFSGADSVAEIDA
jgi:hypothetical protein